jgi:ADP-heptose:LPS heptosyltransferase
MNSGTAKLNNILLVAITRMGDMLQATPLIAGLRAQYPQAKITVLIEKQFAAICEGIPGIDRVREIDLTMVVQCLHRERESIVEAYRYIDDIVSELRAEKFDFCFNMSSSAYTALLLKMAGAKENRGWVSDDEGFRLIRNPWSMLFAAFIYHSNRDFNSVNIVDIFRCSADVDRHPTKLVFEVPERAAGFADEFLANEGLSGDGPLIAIQAGASQEKRQWSPQRCAILSQLLIEKLNARLVFTGSKSERPIIDAIFSHYQHPRMVSAVGRSDLAQLAALLKKADVLITGDTGPMHLSVAVGTPVVALFLASALCFETGPYGPGNLVIQPQIACSPCNPNLPCARPDCHDQVPPELVAYLTELRLRCSDEQLADAHVPADVADPRVVAVYRTEFDAEKFLDFRQINGAARRRDYPLYYFDNARDAHRSLWKSEFGFMSADSPLLKEAANTGYGEVPGLSQAMQLCQEGKKRIDELVKLIKDPRSAPARLGDVNREIARIDRELEDVGLNSSQLGAVIRMFIMEKENLRGDDPLRLASQTKELYDSLHSRCDKYGRLIGVFEKRRGAARK